MHPLTLIAIATGGAVGAVLRHLVGLVVVRQAPTMTFPLPVLCVNVMGAFIMGGLVSLMALHWSPSRELRAFLVVGLLGGFTTFSAFCADFFLLWERGEMGSAALYAALSFGLSLAAFMGGNILARQWV